MEKSGKSYQSTCRLLDSFYMIGRDERSQRRVIMSSSDSNIVCVPGVCAGHPEHPELLWVFSADGSGKLTFQRLEIDFSEPASHYSTQIRRFDVDMDGFERCPYCEADLYFFCKRCNHLSCFDWGQVNSSEKWTCFHCMSQYRMKLKTTPFRVLAHVGDDAGAGQDSGATLQNMPTGITSASPQQTQQGTINVTHLWHPKGK